MPPWRRNQGSKASDESERRKLDRGGAVGPRPLELQAHVAVVENLETVVGQGRTQEASNAIDKFSWRASVSREALYRRAPGSLRRQR